MIKNFEKESCCGCTACLSVCPENCIAMEKDTEGFLYPLVDAKRCVNCGICLEVCLYSKEDENLDLLEKKAYACINSDIQERMNSSSGGVFALLSKNIIKNKGVVFGASFDQHFDVIHRSIETNVDIKLLMGSKYVQSDLQNTFKEADRFLKSGRIVLFSGTPCQIIGLKNYLKFDFENLYTVDVVCHGVPSPLVFQLYKDRLKEYFLGGNITSVNFRDKSDRWEHFRLIVKSEKKIYCKPFYNDLYMRGFIRNVILRPACYNCKVHRLKKKADITLGDYWGIYRIHPDFADKYGTSLVIAGSEKGNKLINECANDMQIIDTDLRKAVLHNQSLISSVQPNFNRTTLFERISKNNINIELKRAVALKGMERFNALKAKIKRVVKRIIRS